MKLLFTFLFASIICISVNAQEYIITKSGKKIECDVSYLNMNKVKTDGANGAQKKYSASELLECYRGDTKYIVAKVPAGTYGARIWCLLEVKVQGDMNLAFLTLKNSTVESDIFYAFLEETPRDSYVKLGLTWRRKLAKLGSSCSGFKSKVKAADHNSVSSLEDLSNLVNYYNENCN